MLEEVCGVEGVLTELGDSWWQVGIVVDSIAGIQLDVLVNPGERKIRLREPVPVPDPEPPKPESFLPPKQKRQFSPVSEWNRAYEQWREWMDG